MVFYLCWYLLEAEVPVHRNQGLGHSHVGIQIL